MENDLRKNPRFLAEGVPALLRVDGNEVPGNIINLSSTGIAIAVDHDLGETGRTAVELSFRTAAGKEIRLSALITNKRGHDGATRLGCHITDMHEHANEYFGFLNSILKQGLIRSMATKPKKVIAAGSS